MRCNQTLITGLLTIVITAASIHSVMLKPLPQQKPEVIYEPIHLTVVSINADDEKDTHILPEEDKLEYHIPAADPADITRLAKMAWGEGRGVKRTMHKAALFWCVFNRVDDPRWPDTVEEVCIPETFHGYSPDNPIDSDLYDLAHDVYIRWQLEKLGDPDPGRVLPDDFFYFWGDGEENHFTKTYGGGPEWDWSLPDPYEEG